MKEYNIGLLKGDGIGPEIIDAGMKVLKAAADVEGFKLKYNEFPFCSDYYLKTGTLITESAISEMKGLDSIYFGALGDPRVAPSVMEVGIILRIRASLEQYINLRPVKLYPNVQSPLRGVDNLDFYIVRENYEDFYTGMNAAMPLSNPGARHHIFDFNRNLYNATFDINASFDQDDDYAVALGVNSRKNINRVMEYCFKLAERKPIKNKKLTCCDKKNIFLNYYGLWQEEFYNVAKNHPAIATDHAHVDAISMWLVKNPQDFGVIVAPNLFGDIITDLGAAISGGLGFAAGGNISPEGVSMFEPIHGSAPKYTGQNVVNPIATIIAGAMMLEDIGEEAAAKRVEDAVCSALSGGLLKTRDMGGTTKTSEAADLIAAEIYKQK